MLNTIDFSYKVAKDQTNLFTPNHRKYIVALSVNDCEPFVTEYQCNKKEHPTIEDVIECVYNDAVTYEIYIDEFDFMTYLGYTDPKQARRAYDACKDAYMWLQTEWKGTQLDELHSELFD